MSLVKKVHILVCLIFSISAFNGILAEDQFDFDDELFGIFDEEGDTVGSFINENDFDIVRNVDPQDILDVLVGLLKADKLLQEDIFLKTCPINKRSLLNKPTFITDKNYKYERWIAGFHTFYDQTSRMYFSKKSSAICSYLALASPSLIRKLEELKDDIKDVFPDFNVDVINGLSLFQNATVQERRFGFMIHGMRGFKKCRFKFKFPFYWLERNFFLTCDERAEIAKELGESDSQAETDRFAKEHMISDRLGFGDLRLAVDFPCYQDIRGLSANIGIFSTVPVSFSIIKGLMGKEFKKCRKRRKLNFTELFEGDPSKILDQLQCFSLGALDGISSILLDSQLGNDRHLGLGLYTNIEIPLGILLKTPRANSFIWKNKVSLEYFLPSREYRHFLEVNDPNLFNRDYEDEDLAAENVAFLEQQLTDKFYPYVYEAKVHPGVVFLWVSKATYESRFFGFHLGWDTWIKSGEKICDICAPKERLEKLDLQKARRNFAFQWDVLGSVFFKVRRPNRQFIVSLNAEWTLVTRGIGRYFLFSLNFESNF